MKFTNLLDKLKMIFTMIANSNVLVILAILLIAVLILRISGKINNKKMGYTIYLTYIVTFGIIFAKKKEFLTLLGSNLVSSIFLNFYFPSVYIYLFVFVISTIIFIYTSINKLMSKTYKIITNIYFLMMNFIFILLINAISEYNIDIFNTSSLFTNNNVLILLEISTLLFVIYLAVIALIYITNCIILHVSMRSLAPAKSKKVKEKTVNVFDELQAGIINNSNNNINVTISEKTPKEKSKLSLSFNNILKNKKHTNKKLNVAKNKKIDLIPELTNIVNTKNKVNTIKVNKEVIKYNDSEIKSKEKIDLIPELTPNFHFIDPSLLKTNINEETTNTNYNQLLTEKINLVDLKLVKNEKEEKLTLNDYKLFSNMLKSIIQNSKSSNLGISEILNNNILNNYSKEEYNKFEKILNSCLN